MALKRRQFTCDFKLQVVREVDAGKPMAQVTRQHQLNPNTVAKWRRQLRQYPQTAFAGQGRAYTDEARVAERERMVGRLTTENDLLKKALALLDEQASSKTGNGSKQVTELVSPSKPEQALALAPACVALSISRATLYRRRGTLPEVDAELRDAIQCIALEMPCYGYRRITAELRRRSFKVSHKAVLRLMREDNLLCLRRKRAFVVTTDSRHAQPAYPNLARDLRPTRSINFGLPTSLITA